MGGFKNMRMTKKVTAVALASMMALSLAGCGQRLHNSNNSSSY